MNSRGRALFWAVLPLLLLTPPLLWQGKRFANQLAEAERVRTQRTLELHASAAQQSFDRIEAKLDSLAVFVAGQTADGRDVDTETFNTFAAGLHASSQWIRAFQIVSNGIITHTYPLQGNEAILGYNLLKDPRPVLGADVLRALRTGRVTITGPIGLIQGGLGIMVRKPLAQTNGAPARLAAIILNIAPLLAESGINEDRISEIRLAIRRENGEVFFGSPTVFAQQPVTCRISLPDGAWVMGGCPLKGWQAGRSQSVRLMYAGGFAVIFLLCALFFARARSEANLSATVREQTEALRSELAARQQAQEQFRLIMENLADMVAVLDLEGRRLYNSPSYGRILGIPGEWVGTSSFEQIHPDDRARVQEVFQETVRTGVGHRLQYRLMDQSGRARHIESQGSVIRDDSGRIAKVVVVSRDVTERQRTEKILQENEARYRYLFEHNPMPMLIYERGTLRMLAVNEAFRKSYGYSEEEALALRLTDLYPDEQKEKIAALIPELQGHAHVGEWRHRKHDGEFITVVVSSHDIAFDGRSARVAVMTDISERKRAEAALQASETRYHLISSVASDYMFSSSMQPDGKLRLEWVAGAFERMTGFTVEEYAARDGWRAMVHPDDRDQDDRDIARLRAGQRIVTELRTFTKSCEIQWVRVYAHPVLNGANGQLTGIYGAVQDITERKRAEEEVRRLHEDLQRHAAELELRVAMRTTELLQARDRAEMADRTKSAFLATMSHELRTPLNSIIGFTGILLQGLAGPLNAEQAKQLEMVRNSARHLLALINDVLDISKIEAGQIEIAPASFDLREAIEKAMHLVAPLAEKKQLPLIKTIAPDVGQIISDRRRVEQILLNLLSNAIKFTPRGTITLAAESVAGTIRISVADTGIGIKPEDLDKLFQPFRQLDTGLTRQHEGTGLGLAICKRLVERLGGTISVESQWAKGSIFRFTLPVVLRKES